MTKSFGIQHSNRVVERVPERIGAPAKRHRSKTDFQAALVQYKNDPEIRGYTLVRWELFKNGQPVDAMTEKLIARIETLSQTKH